VSSWFVSSPLDQAAPEKQAPGQGNYVVFLGKTLNSQCASLYPGVYLGTGEFDAGGN